MGRDANIPGVTRGMHREESGGQDGIRKKTTKSMFVFFADFISISHIFHKTQLALERFQFNSRSDCVSPINQKHSL